MAEAPARPHYVVCNADESEPGTFKDRVLMEEDPFSVLEESPYAALERHDGVEYDLDGHVVPKVEEDPWGRGHAPHSQA